MLGLDDKVITFVYIYYKSILIMPIHSFLDNYLKIGRSFIQILYNSLILPQCMVFSLTY